MYIAEQEKISCHPQASALSCLIPVLLVIVILIPMGAHGRSHSQVSSRRQGFCILKIHSIIKKLLGRRILTNE